MENTLDDAIEKVLQDMKNLPKEELLGGDYKKHAERYANTPV